MHDLRTRGATQIDLIVIDGHEGLLGICAQPTKEGALTQLAAFKAKYGKLY